MRIKGSAFLDVAICDVLIGICVNNTACSVCSSLSSHFPSRMVCSSVTSCGPLQPFVVEKNLLLAKLHVVTAYGQINLIFVVVSIMLYRSEISPTRCNNCVFILRIGFTLHVLGDNLTHHQEYICCIWPQVSQLT